jgi:hypothetical protein
MLYPSAMAQQQNAVSFRIGTTQLPNLTQQAHPQFCIPRQMDLLTKRVLPKIMKNREPKNPVIPKTLHYVE